MIKVFAAVDADKVEGTEVRCVRCHHKVRRQGDTEHAVAEALTALKTECLLREDNHYEKVFSPPRPPKATFLSGAEPCEDCGKPCNRTFPGPRGRIVCSLCQVMQ